MHVIVEPFGSSAENDPVYEPLVCVVQPPTVPTDTLPTQESP